MMFSLLKKSYKWLGLAIITVILAITPAAIAQSTTSTIPLAKINWLQAIFLGFVQGVTEFLPISSTAHLKAIPVFLGWGDPGVTYTAVIQLGSIAAVLSYFWQDLRQICTGMVKAVASSDYRSQDFRLAVGIILGTIPIVFFGLLMKLFIPDLDNSPLRSMTAIACASIVMSLLLGTAEKIGKHKRSFETLRQKDGVLMGLAQALALIPGVSRSGSTLTAGLFMGLERAVAARFSFLLGIPAITLAGLVEFKGVLDQINTSELIPLAIGVISSGIFSYLSIAWLLDYLKKQSTWVFVWYRLFFGVTILIGVALGRFS
ncbi:MAG: undecaprenyl-diphosphate phosphatase [Microcystis wesenbergii TW10]|uniref:Undecaprenyl-diphosphatase n=1 Tax=Microcystis wesenbergii TW10 TaxID=2060474 RepID=A0A3E0LGH1_9CHRO|nr:MAG: undecaprenyl-diphosphate phosphatase [Microcystis wesenbergii TW10]